MAAPSLPAAPPDARPDARPDFRPDALSNVVFLSNSIPKSGSTFLYNLQVETLRAMSGRRPYDFSALDRGGFENRKGFVFDCADPAFLDFLEAGAAGAGPLVVKTHTPVTPALERLLCETDHVFMATLVRDPVQTVLSARDNFHKTGEFDQFADLQTGCDVADTRFREIWESSVRVAGKVDLPILRYEDLIADPVATTVASFPARLSALFLTALVRAREKNTERARDGAQHRFNRGGPGRDLGTLPAAERALLIDRLGPLRARMGYSGA